MYRRRENVKGERERDEKKEKKRKERRSYNIWKMLQCYANIHNIVACCKSKMQNAIRMKVVFYAFL